jgi:Domain of unknown function (DUF4116)
MTMTLDSSALCCFREQVKDALPDVKAFHRAEALARALGFKTNGSLMQFLKTNTVTLPTPSTMVKAMAARLHEMGISLPHDQRKPLLDMFTQWHIQDTPPTSTIQTTPTTTQPRKDKPMTTSQHEPNENIRSQSIILQEGPGLETVVVPTTAEAAAWWSQGTEWSFRDTKNGSFTQHNLGSPIVMVVEPDGSKSGLMVTKTSYMCVDINAFPIKPESVSENSTLYPVLQWAATINSSIDRQMKGSKFKEYNYNDATSCREAVQDNGVLLGHVATHLRTQDLCELAVKRNGDALNDVPQTLRTKEMCELAVRQNGEALFYVPRDLKSSRCENNRSPDLYRLAVEQNGRALRYVPKNLRTPELCRLAVEQDGQAFQHVPENKRTPDLYRLAVQQSGWVLYHIPEEQRTAELCRLAVEQNGLVLEFVPHYSTSPVSQQLDFECACEMQSPTPHLAELLSIARLDSKCALTVRSSRCDDYRTYDICRLAVEQNGMALEFVPMELRTKEICKLAVQNCPGAFSDVPEPFKDELKPIAEQTYYLKLQKEDRLRHEPQWNLSMLDDLKTKIEAHTQERGLDETTSLDQSL